MQCPYGLFYTFVILVIIRTYYEQLYILVNKKFIKAF